MQKSSKSGPLVTRDAGPPTGNGGFFPYLPTGHGPRHALQVREFHLAILTV